MGLKKLVAKTYMRFSRWTCVTDPLPEKVVLIGAPHTSNWDGFFMVMAFWSIDRNYKFLVKESLVKNPFTRPLIKLAHGIAVNRSSSNGTVGSIVEEAKNSDEFALVIAPKGTRANREYWKSGFYRICLETGLPLQLGFVDRQRKEYGWRHSIVLTGDVKADMEKIRSFYEGKLGKRPQYSNVPRLRAEDDAEARERLLGEK